MFEKKYKIGISLSGGGSRGIAHLGVLKFLRETGHEPEIISGASMGAIVGALYAAGHSPEDLIEIFKNNDFSKLFHIHFPKLGFTDNRKIREILNTLLPEDFSGLQKPLYISTTNLNEGGNQLFNSGNLIDVVLASSAIPIVFKPITINGKQYVDGGLTDNMPARVLRPLCKTLIGSHVNYLSQDTEMGSMRDIIARCFRIAIYNTTLDDRNDCDVIIDPPEIRQFGTLDFKDIDSIVEIGYMSAQKQKEEIESAAKRWSIF